MYTYTVYCEVFKLNEKGVPRDRERVREENGYLGVLVFGPYEPIETPPRRRFRAAIVTTNGTEQNIVPPLDDAYLVRLDSRGILIRGIELISRTYSRNSRHYVYPQTWFCKPILDSKTLHKR
jgi:hypothetical protein